MSKAERFRSLAKSKNEPDTTNPSKSDVIDEIVGASTVEIAATSTEKFSSNNNSNSITEQATVTVNQNIEQEHTSYSVNNNTETNNISSSVNSNSITEQSNVTETRRNASATRIPRPIEEFEKRLKRPTIEETHTRATWLVRNDLLKRLEKLAKHQQRGFKTHVVNYAIERILDELEGK
ncbi:hypothetical protein [Alicyclobacillus dauci]|uniref:Uncharacterized protein n=1 Tax=Alicyclobacillus dauci TaxID=1475485 RepID=A0ABY6Z9F6_9BACL|nr:hypothetical protein [Alicyclobacillus dauci]WAH39481.1 hypothetical protein NZD86_24235 [Alicyclobacillus dauci]WAH39541.1 hypothetical protein NZD86_23935 [Alicyclobacillus dauci]